MKIGGGMKKLDFDRDRKGFGEGFPLE